MTRTEVGLTLMKAYIGLCRLNGDRRIARTDAVNFVFSVDTYRATRGGLAPDLAGNALDDLAKAMGGAYIKEGNNGFFVFPDD